MKRLVLTGAAVLLALGASAVLLDPTRVLLGTLRGEPFYRGRPASFWRGALLDAAPGAQTNARNDLAEGQAEVVPLLVELLEKTPGAGRDAAEVRWNAAIVLGVIGEPAASAVPALTAALEDPERLVRVSAADALGKIGPAARDAVPRMAALLQTDEPVRLLKSLRRLRGVNEAAFPAVLDTLTHDDPEARENACETLGEMGPPAKEAVPKLTELLNDPNEKVRGEAQHALDQIVPKPAD